MRRFSAVLILLAFTALLPPASEAAWWRSDDTLVTIDGTRYTAEEFKRWWGFWNDEKGELPPTPDPYVDWLLLAREAERMELDQDPSFRRQTRVFLTSRALLMLKYEAVDSQIQITEEDIRARYEQHYAPRWLLERLIFGDAEAAAAAWRGLGDGTLTVAELREREVDAGGPVSKVENWIRPHMIDPGWVAILQKLPAGGVVDPAEYQEGILLYHLKEVKGGDAEDFARLRDQLRREIWKQQEGERTVALLEDLRRKYEVVIDEERLEALDINAPEESFTDAVVISTNRQSLTEKDFLTLARRDIALRPDAAHAAFDEAKAREVKERVVSGFIAQSLTNWESLDRHYEEREPFKWEYDFHVRHRLTTALETRLFAPEAKVDDAEVKRHYEENLARFTQPALVKLYILDDTQGPVDQVRADVLVGVPFAKSVRDRIPTRVAPEEVPVNHLDPDVKAAVDRLAVGETSGVFSALGSRVLVHLVERTPERPVPLQQAAATIRSRLVREKIDQQRSAYLDLLKARSKIEVKERKWQTVRKELGEAG